MPQCRSHGLRYKVIFAVKLFVQGLGIVLGGEVLEQALVDLTKAESVPWLGFPAPRHDVVHVWRTLLRWAQEDALQDEFHNLRDDTARGYKETSVPTSRYRLGALCIKEPNVLKSHVTS